MNRRVVSAEAIVEALEATGGNVSAAADRLGTTRLNLRGHAVRRGLDLTQLRANIRAQLRTPLEPPPSTGDDAPFAPPVLASALVDMAALGDLVQQLQAEIEVQGRIIARLIGALQALEGKTVHELSTLFAHRRRHRGRQPAFARARAALLRAE